MNFLVLLLLCYSTAKAQTYLPLFGIDSTEWNVHTIRFLFGDGWRNDKIKGTSLTNDTIIFPDGSKVFKTINNDSAWLINHNIGSELLVFDLTLEQADSFLFYTYENNVLDSSLIFVDSVYVYNGRKIITFERDLSYHPSYNDPFLDFKFSFIEGVGPNFFYTYPILNTPYIVNVICKKENENYVYESEDIYTYSNCKLATDISNIPKEQFNVSIQNNTIQIENIKNEYISNITIVDLLGRKVFEETDVKSNYYNITLNKSGIFFLSLETTNGFYSQKIYLP